MDYVVQQQDIDIIKSKELVIYSKLEILNNDLRIIDILTPILLNDSFSIDAESSVRRTYSCDLHLKNADYFLGENKKLWMNRKIRPHIGLVNQRTKQTQWYCMGTYCLIEGNYSYNSTTRTLSLNCNDLMSTLNGELNGRLKGYTIQIENGANARNAIISILKECGITKYSICDLDFTIPNDEFKYNANTTAYDILNDILSLYSGYEMFFDVNGVFTIQPIPTCEDDDVILENELFRKYVVSEDGLTINFSEIYNHIQVWGMSIDVDGFTDSSTFSNGVYSASIASVSEYKNFQKYGIAISAPCSANSKLNINNLGAKPIMIDEEKPLSDGYISSGDYAFRYRKSSDDFLLLGQYQVFGEAWDDNPDSPFNVTNLGYEILYTCEGGDYAKIYTDDLANQRARYERYLHTNLQQQLNLTTLIIPWLDVNWKITYKSENSDDVLSYIIKSISGSTKDGTMTISMVRFYPDYPEIN